MAQLKKSQTEAQKHAQSLEISLRETKEQCSQLENNQVELENQLRGMQSELEEERRDCSLGTVTIADLQGESCPKNGKKWVENRICKATS